MSLFRKTDGGISRTVGWNIIFLAGGLLNLFTGKNIPQEWFMPLVTLANVFLRQITTTPMKK
jgi:hypothetical protein